MKGITTHILDTGLGLPAQNVKVSISFWQENRWQLLKETSTNTDGRAPDLAAATAELKGGVYKLHFAISDYFIRQKRASFYPYIEIIFDVSAEKSHYHVPLLLNAYGYSTYRGS
jgi:5-hydroxyisourate hydrolase